MLNNSQYKDEIDFYSNIIVDLEEEIAEIIE